MLDRFFHCGHVAQLRAGPFAEQLEEFCRYLESRGHARVTVRQYLREAVRFVTWIAAQKIPLRRMDERVIRLFARKQHLWEYRHPAPGHVHIGLRHMLRMLRSTGHAAPAPGEQPESIGYVVAEYDRYLSDTCGLAFETRFGRTRFAREFLRATFGAKKIRWDRLRPKHLCAFVASFGRSGRIASGVVAASAL